MHALAQADDDEVWYKLMPLQAAAAVALCEVHAPAQIDGDELWYKLMPLQAARMLQNTQGSEKLQPFWRHRHCEHRMLGSSRSHDLLARGYGHGPSPTSAKRNQVKCASNACPRGWGQPAWNGLPGPSQT